jgi:hypothetical protein
VLLDIPVGSAQTSLLPTTLRIVCTFLLREVIIMFSKWTMRVASSLLAASLLVGCGGGGGTTDQTLIDKSEPEGEGAAGMMQAGGGGPGNARPADSDRPEGDDTVGSARGGGGGAGAGNPEDR